LDTQAVKKTAEEYLAEMNAGAAVRAIDELTQTLKANRPVSAPAEIAVTALRPGLMTHVFPAYRYSWEPYFPLRATCALNAEGGAGKSWLMLSQQLHGAAGKPYLDAPTREGVYVYLSCEDDTEIVERRAQKILATFSEEERAKALHNFKLIDGVGKGLRLVTAEAGGIVGIAPVVDKIITAAKEAAAGRPIVQGVGDTVSRLLGGQEAQEFMSAVEQAGVRIAQALDCAWVFLHHVSKVVAREGITDAHTGRGGSSFGDNCRSVLRLMPLTWQMVVREKLDGLDRLEVERGDVLKLLHAKLNQGRKADPIYLRRGVHGLLERIKPTVRTEAQTADVEMAALVKWFNGKRKAEPFSIFYASRTAAIEWTKMPQAVAKAFLEEAARDGRLIKSGEAKGKALYVPSEDALTRGVVHSSDDWLGEF
jgi:hypothetical protein